MTAFKTALVVSKMIFSKVKHSLHALTISLSSVITLRKPTQLLRVIHDKVSTFTSFASTYLLIRTNGYEWKVTIHFHPFRAGWPTLRFWFYVVYYDANTSSKINLNDKAIIKTCPCFQNNLIHEKIRKKMFLFFFFLLTRLEQDGFTYSCS